MKRENENNTPPTEQEVDKLKLKIMKKEEEENYQDEDEVNNHVEESWEKRGIVPPFSEWVDWDDYNRQEALREEEINDRDEDEIYKDELPF